MNFLRRFWNWLHRKKEKKELVVVHRGHEVSGVRKRHPEVARKPPKAIHQDYGKFFRGKGARPHLTYRKSVKAKIQPEGD